MVVHSAAQLAGVKVVRMAEQRADWTVALRGGWMGIVTVGPMAEQ